MSAKFKRASKFNPIQIKDGHIVRLRKDGRIAAVLDTWPTSNNKKKDK